jgi:hypothetical protein
MTEVSISSGDLAAREAGPDPRRWLLLVVIGIAQLMVMLDATIVNIALPRRRSRWASAAWTGSGW